MTDEPAIATRGLAKTFGDAMPAIAGLDLEIRRGELFGLVGPDGAGKSTLIRLLCGLLQPTAGSARVLGCDLLRQPGEIKRRIGYLSQNFTLYGDLTADENIEFFSRLHGTPSFRKRRDELLEFTRLTPFRSRLADKLSGGMKKKLALACTLIHTPELIFLDEPSTGVDPVSRGEFWNILSGILAQGVTLLMTTPYLDEAERCHRICLIHQGRAFITGTPAEIKRSMPGAVYDCRSPSPAAAYKRMRARWDATSLALRGDSLRWWTPGGAEAAGEAAAWLDAGGCGPAVFDPSEPDLEDAFIAILETGKHG